MRIFRDDSLSILPTLPFNHLCADLKFYFHCLHTLITQLCFMFHPLKLKTHNTALSQANEWKIFDWVVRRILNRLKISFTRSRDPDCDTGTLHWWPHILDKIDWKCFIRQWLLVAGLQTNISQRKHFRILPSFVIPRDWNLNGSVWIKNDPEFIISVIYCLAVSQVLIKHCLWQRKPRDECFPLLQITIREKHYGSVKSWQPVRIRNRANRKEVWEEERTRRAVHREIETFMIDPSQD